MIAVATREMWRLQHSVRKARVEAMC
jgi:hypothetical protein